MVLVRVSAERVVGGEGGVACGVWRVARGAWRVACGAWRVACGVWRGGWPRGGELLAAAAGKLCARELATPLVCGTRHETGRRRLEPPV